jgi:formyl-CoA transferase
VEQAMVGWLVQGTVTQRRGYRGAISAASGGFPCRDGYWMVSVPHTAEGWGRLMDWVQDPELAADPALADERERFKKRDFILDRLTQWSEGHSKYELVPEAQERHIPASPVTTALDLVADPQLLERGFLHPTDLPHLGSVTFPIGAIANVLNTQMAPAPRLGQHNQDILAELGYSAEDIGALVESGTV